MGFWGRKPVAASDSSSPIEHAAAASSKDDSSSSPFTAQPTTAAAATRAPAAGAVPQKSRDDIAEEEFSALLKTLHAEEASNSESSKSSTSFQDTLYPTTMSCREAFDELYFCYSLGGQFKNLYRYGTYRECEDKSSDFWFCMKTKMYGPNTKKEMIVKYHKEKEAAKYKRGPSSEDVWSVRTKPLQGQFMGNYEHSEGKQESYDREA
ncbi:hypothetical protein H072_1508 [Dactylellina haptotyla CBS 200.50]|uniref:Early meiotic induction protein 1 n=1 Tax=Dactylellina haptotyla (strain CBS 200.50) TaxID=1284197 RepID=S8ANG1_DACHA|nr:hypothetical protein H072_1508 [Dactylellina haptotyla CBS 200.50]